ncbi:GNAT family N-acetyltransferase [Mesorhizobium sp. B2-4-15]|uniref:GNAT family N-acetyltransferase n=1 Tax=Mesorhizobium sp. B2-4-15 TaxID=2589934 RepID=UPI001AEE6FAA|nr:GNAT family N-acetyltransferase [Mesorhizobium sp. B2-4-15]
MMADIKISKEQTGERHGRYVARIEGIAAEAEITFTKRGADLISADHTGAPETLRGTGAAAALVSFMVEDARRSGFRILPICPYVRAQYRKHPEWADVMTLPPGAEPNPGKHG